MRKPPYQKKIIFVAFFHHANKVHRKLQKNQDK